MDPKLYRAAMGGKEKMGGEENEKNDDDVLYLMQCINDQQQLELQLISNKNTVLHVAAQFGNQKYVQIILEKSPSSSLLRCLNIDGETPLQIVARVGHLDIVKALIQCAKRLDHEEVESGGGAAMEMLRATNKDNDTALHIAVRNPRNSGVLKDIEFIRPPNNAGVVEWLTKEDPEFTHPPNNAKETPLYLASERQRNDMVSMILKNCTSPANGGPKGQTALHTAAKSSKLLLEWKSDLIKEIDEYGWTPLHYVAHHGNVNGVKRILEKDKSVAYITTDEEDDEKTALHIAAARGNVRVMEELLSQCPDCWEMKGIEGNTPPLYLLITAFGIDMPMFGIVLWAHSTGDWNATNNNNVTPQGIMWSRVAEVRMLI
ncbi:hypothetical protein HYC85_003348 [Camellia sinensis]|uniref:PGG domain-containing protein n=1 Tax=Camellia sinensis TaxID=4442 RepID=A0A7J7IB34_CAMSI|nr:hypothetical protein HYC85_003348 [Camellia sinensis]